MVGWRSLGPLGSLGAAFRPAMGALQVLRGHWGIENRLFYVLDVTWREDSQWGRWIARGLHLLREWATALLRAWGFRWVPSGQRACDAAADALRVWLVQGGLSPGCVNS